MEEIIHFDQQLLLALNGSDSPVLDRFFMMVTCTGTWIPLLLLLLYIILKNRPWREALFFFIGMALVVLIADRFTSGFCKPTVHRFRPSHEPALEGLVDLVGDYRGGLYGFISSHAANTFGLWTFIALYLRRRGITFTVLLWACLSSYSRIYLGLHYPGDILCGALFGICDGILCLGLFLYACQRIGQPLRPQWPVALTALGYNSNPGGIQSRDVRLFTVAFLITLLVMIILSFIPGLFV